MNSRKLSNITTCAPYLSLTPNFFLMSGIYRNKINRFCSYTKDGHEHLPRARTNMENMTSKGAKGTTRYRCQLSHFTQ